MDTINDLEIECEECNLKHFEYEILCVELLRNKNIKIHIECQLCGIGWFIWGKVKIKELKI